MFTFNKSGLLVPDGKIISTLETLHKEFVIKIPSDRRKQIFDLYLKYNEDLIRCCGQKALKQWIDGSFVTKKEKPEDIDVVTFLDTKLVTTLGNKLNDFLSPNSEIIYGVDAYIIETHLENNPKQFYYESDYAYWYDFFTKTRRNRGNRLSKGFLEITI
jgi:hypothetical protein